MAMTPTQPTTAPICSSCTFWAVCTARTIVTQGRAQQIGGDTGECHRRSPQKSYQWPRTNATDWCAEHQARYAENTAERPKRARAAA